MKGVIFGAGVLCGLAIGAVCLFSYKRKKDKEVDDLLAELNAELDRARKETDRARQEAVEGARSLNELISAYSSSTGNEFAKMPVRGSQSVTEAYMTDPAEREHPSDDEPETDISEDVVASVEVDPFAKDDPRLTDPVYDDAVAVNLEVKKGKAPRIITVESFEDEYAQFDKVTLYFYYFDGVLASEDEELIDNVDDVVGDALDKYGFRDSDERYIYVRNFNLSTDYEIIKVMAAFGDGTHPLV